MLWRHIDWILADHGGGSALRETSKNADGETVEAKEEESMKEESRAELQMGETVVKGNQ